MPSINTPSIISLESLFTEYFDVVFDDFLKPSANPSILIQNKAGILNECRKKFRVEALKEERTQACDELLQVLKKTVYSSAYIPDGLIGTSDALEPDSIDPINNELSDLNKLARNVFRYIIRGTEIDGKRHDISKGLAFVEKVLSDKRHPDFTRALREEFQQILTNIGDRLIKEPNKQIEGTGIDRVSESDEIQYNILISNLLAAYTFLDPYEERKTLWVPQKIEGQGWRNIEYNINKLDLSPQTGPLSKLISDEDRIYAYGLVPVEPNSPAQRQLLLMGTTYPSGQGSAFSTLHKFDPMHSVGEAYDWTILEQWINSQNTKIKVTGHSQGGSSAMFVAASYPEHITEANCLNPPALCTATINRLNPKWSKIPKQNRPHIHVYAQQGDPAYPLENGFLDGTRIFRIISGVEKCSNLNPWLPKFFQKALEAHLHHFSGRQSSIILELDACQESFTHEREFVADMKGTINWTLYPFMYCELVMELSLRNIKMWCLDNLPSSLTTSAAVAGFIPYYALKLTLNMALFLTKATLLVAELMLTAVCSSVKIGIKSSLNISHKPPVNDPIDSINESTILAY